MWYTYVLKSQKDDGWYIGCTDDLKKDSNHITMVKLIQLKIECPYFLFITKHVYIKLTPLEGKDI